MPSGGVRRHVPGGESTKHATSPARSAPVRARIDAARASVSLRGEIRIRGVNPYLEVPATLVARLAPKRGGPIPVRFRVNGGPVRRLCVMPARGGAAYLYLNGEVRRAARVDVGDTVVVEMSIDREYRGGPAHPMPRELLRYLSGHPAAQAAWNALVPSLQKEVVRYLAHLRGEAARERNVALTIRVLEGDELRFLGRSWSRGKAASPAAARRPV